MLILFLASDSTSVDTVQTYDIPELVSFQDGISVAGETTPAFYQQSSIDILSGFPFTIFTYGFGQVGSIAAKGRKPSYLSIYLNGRPLHTHPQGYVNQAMLPLHFFAKLSYGRSIIGAELSAVNLVSKTNQYDLPYSYAHFLFGSFQSNTYGIDLTRAVTNDLGFYVSGQYYKTGGYRNNADQQAASFYSNVYYNRFLPIRVDVFYVNDEYGFGGSTQLPLNSRQKDQTFDISSTIDIGNSVITLFYEYQSMGYEDTTYGKSLVGRTDQLGMLFSRHDTLRGAILDYGIHGFLTNLDGSIYRQGDLSEADLWARARVNAGRFFLHAGGSLGVAKYHETHFCPKVECGLSITGSTYLSASVSRDVRPPSDFELWSPLDTLIPYFNVAGDSSLETEYCWTGEMGVRGENYAVNLYRLNFDNLITASAESVNYYEYVNVDSWRTSGCEVYINVPLRFHDSDSSRVFVIMIGGGGNVLLEGDSVPYVPQYHGGGHLSIIRETNRLSFGIALRGELYGTRREISGQSISGFGVMSVAGLVKFMDLSCVVRLNNVFDQEYAYAPYYPMVPRNYDVSIKWEFWD